MPVPRSEFELMLINKKLKETFAKNTRESYYPTNTTMSKKLPRKAYLSDSLDEIYGSQWRDQSKMQRAYFYSKYQKVIDLMDTFEIWTLNMLHSICLENLNHLSPSRNTLKVICKYLTMDEILLLKVVPTGALKPASVYYLPILDQKELDLFCKEYTEHDKAFQNRKKKRTPEEQGEYWRKQQLQAVGMKERKQAIIRLREERNNPEWIKQHIQYYEDLLGKEDFNKLLDDLKINLE